MARGIENSQSHGNKVGWRRRGLQGEEGGELLFTKYEASLVPEECVLETCTHHCPCVEGLYCALRRLMGFGGCRSHIKCSHHSKNQMGSMSLKGGFCIFILILEMSRLKQGKRPAQCCISYALAEGEIKPM